MLNLLEDYIRDSLPKGGEFITNPNLRKKVDDSGNFLPFCGNTVVFLLDDDAKRALAQVCRGLYEAAGQLLSQKLDPGTFHMTLHDLVNGAPDEAGLEDRMAEAEKKARQLLSRWQDQPPLHMRATWLFNMVNTSIVLGLAPADADSYARLDAMYAALESVVPLGYALTPHITVAYFHPGSCSGGVLEKLRGALGPVTLDVTLSMADLKYQEFSDMNHYKNC